MRANLINCMLTEPKTELLLLKESSERLRRRQDEQEGPGKTGCFTEAVDQKDRGRGRGEVGWENARRNEVKGKGRKGSDM